MSRWKIVLPFAVGVIAAAIVAGGAFSQEDAPAGATEEETPAVQPAPAPAPTPAPAEEPRPERQRRRFDPAQFRQRALERTKEALGATDEEWQVLEPLVEKVQTLSRQARSGGRRGMFGRRGRRGGGDETTAPQTETEKAVQGLRTILENEAATSDEIKVKLTALRETREKTRQELDKAQEELRVVLTVRQEAQLVLMGLLD